MKMDLAYIENWSFDGQISKLIFRTVKVVMLGERTEGRDKNNIEH